MSNYLLKRHAIHGGQPRINTFRAHLTPFAFTLTAVLVAIGVNWFHFLDIVPIARDRVIESMTDGVIVLDEQDRVVDINASGRA